MSLWTGDGLEMSTLLLIGGAVFAIGPVVFALFVKVGADKYLKRTATISTTLRSFMADSKITTETSIHIVGGKCANIDSHPEYPWVTHLEDWLKAGASIKYLLIDSTPQSKMHLTTLSEKYPKLSVYLMDNIEKISDNSIRHLAEEARTTHFVLFNHPKLMWLEGNHPAGSQTAFNCEFVNERRAKRDTRYDSLNRLFNDFCKQAESSFALAVG